MNKPLFGLSPAVVDQIKLILSRHSALEGAILYGSRAKGTSKPGSDIDLTLKGELLTTTDLLAIENELDSLMLPYQIDLSLFHQIKDPALVDHIQRVGKAIYTRIRKS